jgi:CDP-diacylglycerol--glycerol-3-phosphate 3-phosphatidyltransferase
MPSIYELKPRFQALLRPLVGALARAGVTANQVTLAAVALSVGVGASLWRDPGSRAVLLAVPVALFVRMTLNAVDGMLAREYHQRSALGAVLNELGDVISDSALYLPFACLPGLPAALVVAIVLLAVVGEMTGVVGLQVGASRRYDGPMGKSDRAFAFGLLALLLAFGVTPGRFTTGFLALVAALAALTILNRAQKALREAGA